MKTEVDMKKNSEDSYGLLFATMWKRSTKKILPVLFLQQLDDRGSMGVVKIGTDTMPV